MTMWCIQVSHDQFEGQCDAKLPLLAAVALKEQKKNSPSTEYNSWQVGIRSTQVRNQPNPV